MTTADKIDVAKLAKEAGAVVTYGSLNRTKFHTFMPKEIEHFARLVMEDCAMTARGATWIHEKDMRDEIASLIEARMP